MLTLIASLMLLVVQPAAGATPAPVTEPAAAVAEAPKPYARMETIFQGLRGKGPGVLTKKLGPAESVRKGSDGEVMFWSVNVPGETVCGADASGSLVCGRQGAGTCGIAAAFQTEGGLSKWRIEGYAPACETAADLMSQAD